MGYAPIFKCYVTERPVFYGLLPLNGSKSYYFGKNNFESNIILVF